MTARPDFVIHHASIQLGGILVSQYPGINKQKQLDRKEQGTSPLRKNVGW